MRQGIIDKETPLVGTPFILLAMTVKANPKCGDEVEVAQRRSEGNVALDQHGRDEGGNPECSQQFAVGAVLDIGKDVGWSIDAVGLVTTDSGRRQKIPRTTADIQDSQGTGIMEAKMSDAGEVERNPKTVVGVFGSAGGVSLHNGLHLCFE